MTRLAVLVAALALAGSAGAATKQPSLIVFAATPPSAKATQLYSIRPSGDGLRQITKGAQAALYPEFSPNGQRIAFARFGVGIFTIDPDGGRLKRITTNGRDAYPTWSPDGTRLAFVRPVGPKWSVFVVRTSGGKPKLLKRTPPAGRPSWTKQGLFIPSGGDLMRIDASTGRVLKYFGADIDAIWGLNTVTVAPDSKLLTYVGARDPVPGDQDCGDGPCQRYGLYQESLTSKRKLGKLIVKDASPAAFSRNGKQLAFAVGGGLAIRTIATGATKAISTGAAVPTTGSAPTWR